MLKIILALFMLVSFLDIGQVRADDQDPDQDRDRDRIQLRDPDADQDQDRLRERDRLDDDLVYGSQLMTKRERREYRQQMRALKTQEAREEFRRRHHEEMRERAKAMGKSLPEEVPQGMERGHRGNQGPGGSGRGGYD